MVEDALFDLAEILAGDRRAWAAFVRRHAPVIHGAVLKRLVPAGLQEDSDDVAQEVFLRLCRNDFRLLRRFDAAKARLTTYLTVVATSTAIDHQRRRRLPKEDLDKVPESDLSVAPPEAPVEIKIPEGLLSPRQSLALELLYFRDLDPAEAGKIMGIDAQSVRSMHHKALTKLRKHFAGLEGDF